MYPILLYVSLSYLSWLYDSDCNCWFYPCMNQLISGLQNTLVNFQLKFSSYSSQAIFKNPSERISGETVCSI